MRTWAFILGGPTIWTAHFFGVYALASLGAVLSSAEAPNWRLAIALFSAACLTCALVLAGLAVRRLRSAPREAPARFAAELATVGAVLSAVAIVWQALPAWIGH